jgi:hypothetical protein
MLTRRLEILFDQKEFEILRKKAKARGRSVASLIRETMREKIIDTSITEKERALKRIFSLANKLPLGDWKREKAKMIKARVREIETH